MRYLEAQHFRVLIAVEMGMKNHELVPLALISAIAGIHRGAVSKALSDLIKHKLVIYERGKRYDGYRINYLGYDFLALRALCSRGIVGSVGNQIGVGKESDVYVGGDPELNDLVLKLHRLGRISFRKLKEKRDYHKKRQYCSWLYLSRIAALKEFTFLKVLHDKKFPVPKPIDVCRHVIVMELIDGFPLSRIEHVPDPAQLYDQLVSLIVRLGRYGLIHGDFNEFNLMLNSKGEPMIIDFPQMVSIDHPNAEFYFNRDVICIRDYFRRKFNYESEEYPKFSDVERKYNLDVEVEASGFTKQMAKDLNKAYDEGDFEAHIDEESETSSYEDEEAHEASEYDEEELEEETANAQLEDAKLRGSDRFNSWLQDAHEQLEQLQISEDGNFLPLKEMDEDRMEKYKAAIEETEQKLTQIEKLDDETNENEQVENDDREDVRSRGTRVSVYSNGSTISKTDIKKRLVLERNKAKKQRIKVKGKQSAVRRERKQNLSVIKEYSDWDL
uniref:Serine/threonine-protein kinase RIO2 n=1 Tax=Acrobeloides nanus TaxID=290746 RepID=A0A914DFG1_9BILA